MALINICRASLKTVLKSKSRRTAQVLLKKGFQGVPIKNKNGGNINEKQDQNTQRRKKAFSFHR